MFFPTQVRAHHSGSRRMPTRWPANCSVSPGSCDSLERAPGLRRPGCSSGAAPSTRPRRPCTFSRTTASTTSTNNTAPRTHREHHEPVRGKGSPHPEGGGPPWMKTPHHGAAVEFLGGQVQESGFRVGVPISCRCPRRVRRGLDATASVGVPYDVRVRESSPGGSYGTVRRGFSETEAISPGTRRSSLGYGRDRIGFHRSALRCGCFLS